MAENARHARLRSEPIHTSLGVIQLDDRGLAANLSELGITADQLIDTVPGFLDADVFAGDPNPPLGQAPTPEPVPETVEEAPGEGERGEEVKGQEDQRPDDSEAGEQLKSEGGQLEPAEGEQTDETQTGNEGAPAADDQPTETSDSASGAASEESDADDKTDQQEGDAKQDGKEASDEELWTVIDELEKAGAKKNSKGYIDMEALNGELRKRGFEIITGTKRVEVTDKNRSK